ncbi:MAG: hypothetical protein PVH79_04510, partial [Candidatus Bathyarchaeota archaeon]
RIIVFLTIDFIIDFIESTGYSRLPSRDFINNFLGENMFAHPLSYLCAHPDVKKTIILELRLR